MRWDSLFDDLEAQFESELRLEQQSEVADRTRRERALVGLADRIRAERGRLDVRLTNGDTMHGTVDDLGKDWMLLDRGVMGPALIPLPAVVWISGLGNRAVRPARVHEVALGLPLRALARDRALVSAALSVAAVSGTIDRVGSDAFDLADLGGDLQLRQGSVRTRLTVPFAHLCAVTPVRG